MAAESVQMASDHAGLQAGLQESGLLGHICTAHTLIMARNGSGLLLGHSCTAHALMMARLGSLVHSSGMLPVSWLPIKLICSGAVLGTGVTSAPHS